MQNQNLTTVTASIASSDIQSWLVAYLADLLDIAPEEIDVTVPFERYGLDSVASVGLLGDLAKWLGRKLDPSVVNEYPSIEALTGYLS
jgi:acyl carrier protein